MSDIRELILLRLMAIAEAMRAENFLKSVDRNKLDISESRLPQFVLLDADELAAGDDPVRTGARGRAVMRRVEMTPQAFFCAKALSEEAGSALNVLRAEWLRRVLNDDELTTLTGENGYVRYEEAISSFRIGKQLDATMLVTVSFGYMLLPTAL